MINPRFTGQELFMYRGDFVFMPEWQTGDEIEVCWYDSADTEPFMVRNDELKVPSAEDMKLIE